MHDTAEILEICRTLLLLQNTMGAWLLRGRRRDAVHCGQAHSAGREERESAIHSVRQPWQ